MPSKRRSSKRPYGLPHAELDTARISASVGARRERGPGGEEYVVAVPRRTDKEYVCPACRQPIPGDSAHLVTWAADGLFGPEVAASERRHWHTRCWESFGRTHD